MARARVTRGEPLSNESADSLVKYSLSVIWMRVSSTVKRHNSIHRDPLTIHLPARSPIVIFLVPSNYPRAHPPPPPRAPALCKTGENGLSLRPGKSVNRVDRRGGKNRGQPRHTLRFTSRHVQTFDNPKPEFKSITVFDKFFASSFRRITLGVTGYRIVSRIFPPTVITS